MTFCLNLFLLKAGVKHIILAVSYRAEMLEKEMKQQQDRVSLLKF